MRVRDTNKKIKVYEQQGTALKEYWHYLGKDEDCKNSSIHLLFNSQDLIVDSPLQLIENSL